MSATIEVTRGNDGFGRFRRLQVLVDGEVAMRLKIRSTDVIDVPPGAHTLSLRMDWCESEPITVDLKPNEHRRFVCRSPSAWQALSLVFTNARLVFALEESVEG